MINKIILAFKTHFDFGFTDLAEKVLEQYTGNMLQDIVSACVDTASMDAMKFVFTLPAWPLGIMTDSDETGDLARLVAADQVAWHALPFTSHTDFAGVEDTIESLRYARELSEKFGKPLAASAKMTDVPGHGWILPTILAGAGIQFLHLGCNEYAMPPEVPELFFWEGPDGSRVLTMYCPDGYGSSELMPADWPFPVWLSMMHTHDNDGPQSPEAIRQIVAEAQAQCPGVEIVSGALDDFYRELSKCDLSGVPVIRGDLADTWIHGVGSYPGEVAQIREARRKVLAAQKCLALSGADPEGAAMTAVRQVYDNLVLFDEHTWGLDVKTWMQGKRVYEKGAFNALLDSPEYRQMELSWQEQRDRAGRAATLAGELLETLGSPQENLLNPGGGAYTGWVTLGENAKDTGVIPIFGQLAAYREAQPALSVTAPAAATTGFAPLVYETGADGSTIRNHRYSICFNESTGAVQQVWDHKLGVALLESNNGAGVFAYAYDVYGMEEVQAFLDSYCYIDSDWGIKDNGRLNYKGVQRQTFQPRFLGWEQQGWDVIFRYAGTGTAAYGDASGVEVRITLPPLGDEFFVELRLRGKEKTPCVESASLILPHPESFREYRFNKNGTLINPRTDILRGANHVLYCLEAFGAVGSETAGVCVVAHDTPLLSIGEPGIYQFRQEFQETLPQLRFNLFNNMWGTNFPQWMGGDFTYRFTLWGYEGEKGLMQRGLSLFDPPRPVRAPVAACPLRLPEEIQVLNAKPFGDGMLIRLRDTSGTARQLQFASTESGKRLQRTDLQEVPFGEVTEGAILAQLGSYGILSLYLY